MLFPTAIGNRKDDVICSDNVLMSSVTNIDQYATALLQQEGQIHVYVTDIR
jgi:hypothetical protein